MPEAPMQPVDPRRRVPRTDTLLADARLVAATDRLGTTVVKAAVQRAQALVRAGALTAEDVVDAALRALPPTAASVRAVINATGVVLHTNLGRAPLSAAAVAALTAASGYVDVEFDLSTGARSRRGEGALAAVLAAVPEAEDALIVNNGAAALILAATALAAGREIVLGRGELIEIGDGFRIPELLECTGARIREVGTTNRTHLPDYASALGPETAFVLKVHPSNFTVDGFTSSVSVGELAGLGVPVVADVGSGLLTPLRELPDEPDISSWLRAGADIVTASADKLLGGPQGGLIVGRRELLAVLRRHPLYRALRVDKLTVAALEATLVGPAGPTHSALTADAAQLRRRAEELARALGAAGVTARVVGSDGLVGGGGAPGRRLPGWAVELSVTYAASLRTGRPPVVARVERNRCLLDLRCVPADDDVVLRDAVLAAGCNDERIDGATCT
jgi:L-seryl-tRNA(Ser) seleniumtransferase